MHTSRILLVVTSADRMGHSPEPTGSWLEEVVAPYYTFLDAKYDVTIASPLGGHAPIDETSLKPENLTAATRRYDADLRAQKALAHTIKLSTIDPTHYDAVFFAGGHGTMEDFAKDEQVKSLVEYFHAAQKPVSAVCHGPACFLRAVKPNGDPLIKGHRFTCFTDEEETAIGQQAMVPFMLEGSLNRLGGISNTALPFKPKVVIDGALITGQNPASAIPAAEAVIHYLRNNFIGQYAA